MNQYGPPPKERFWMKVDKQGEDECWEWKAYCDNRGYGIFWNGSIKVRAHNFSYEEVYSPTPKDHNVYQKCNNKKCVNPKHLALRSIHYRSPLEERFWKYVNKRGEDECWEWTGSRIGDGYGQFSESMDGEHFGAHRFSYILHYGAIPEGEIVCHICNNPPCVNPKHLESGTYSHNTQYAASLGRLIPPKGEKNGRSKLTEENVKEIKRMLENGIKQHVIAEHFSVCRTAIGLIKRGERWNHVTLDN